MFWLTAAQETGEIQPMGWVLIIGFLVFFIGGLIYDKKKKDSFIGDLAAMLQEKSIDNMYGSYITSDRALIWILDGGYMTCKLDDIYYISYGYDTINRNYGFTLRDEKGHVLKGKRYRSVKKKAEKCRMGTWVANREEAQGLFEFFKKHVPKVQLKEEK